MSLDETTKEEFWEKSASLLLSINRQTKKRLIVGDINDHVGRDNQKYEVCGVWGLEERNPKG